MLVSNQVEYIGAIGPKFKAEDDKTYQPHRFRYVSRKGIEYTVDVETAIEDTEAAGEEIMSLTMYVQACTYFVEKLHGE